MSLQIPYTYLQDNFIIWASFERKFFKSWGNFFLNDGLFRTLEVILQSYMLEKMLISNSKKTVQDYQCELNFGGLGIDIREYASFQSLQCKEVIRDHRLFKF